MVLLFSLVASGQIKLRKIDGWPMPLRAPPDEDRPPMKTVHIPSDGVGGVLVAWPVNTL